VECQQVNFSVMLSYFSQTVVPQNHLHVDKVAIDIHVQFLKSSVHNTYLNK